jgi:hypothetical protein
VRIEKKDIRKPPDIASALGVCSPKLIKEGLYAKQKSNRGQYSHHHDRTGRQLQPGVRMTLTGRKQGKRTAPYTPGREGASRALVAFN